jgi:phosphate transport system substrate-binding protein
MKKRDYAGGSQKMAGNEQIAAEVGKNAHGVGYVGMAYTKAGGVKVMPIDGVVPSVKSVQDHSYAYWRPTFYYTSGEPSGLAKQFLDYTIGAAGQKVVAQVGFVPIK